MNDFLSVKISEFVTLARFTFYVSPSIHIARSKSMLTFQLGIYEASIYTYFVVIDENELIRVLFTYNGLQLFPGN